MTSKTLHVLAISGGWCWLTVPRLCIFGDQEPEITEWDYGIWHGTEPETAVHAARKAREIQGLEYKCGPAIIVQSGRFGAMLELLQHQNLLGDSMICYLDEAPDISDERLRSLHMYVGNEDISAAVKRALTALRKARADRSIAHEMWPYPPNGLA